MFQLSCFICSRLNALLVTREETDTVSSFRTHRFTLWKQNFANIYLKQNLKEHSAVKLILISLFRCIWLTHTVFVPSLPSVYCIFKYCFCILLSSTLIDSFIRRWIDELKSVCVLLKSNVCFWIISNIYFSTVDDTLAILLYLRKSAWES